jgi:hypothetical protein
LYQERGFNYIVIQQTRVGREIPVAGIPGGYYREIPSWEIL